MVQGDGQPAEACGRAVDGAGEDRCPTSVGPGPRRTEEYSVCPVLTERPAVNLDNMDLCIMVLCQQFRTTHYNSIFTVRCLIGYKVNLFVIFT